LIRLCSVVDHCVWTRRGPPLRDKQQVSARSEDWRCRAPGGAGRRDMGDDEPPPSGSFRRAGARGAHAISCCSSFWSRFLPAPSAPSWEHGLRP
jgi:hypothetical protein